MATRPDKLPEWATVDEIDPVSGQSNVVEPPPERKESGWTRREIPPRQWFNWLARYYKRWIEWARDILDAATNIETPGTIAKRDASGRMRAADPVDAQDVVTKNWAGDNAGILSANFLDSPVDIGSQEVNSTSSEQTSVTGSFDLNSISGLTTDAKMYYIHFGIRVSGDFHNRFGIKLPSHTSYKWIIGSYTIQDGNDFYTGDESPFYGTTEGNMTHIWFPAENGIIEWKAENVEIQNFSLNAFVIAEIE